MGCDWGAPAQMLIREHGCEVLALTNARSQYRHCADLGLPVRLGDMEAALPPGRFDCALLLESFSHVRDKARLLKLLRPFTDRLVLRAHCQDAAPPERRFAGTMHMIPSTQLREIIEASGWTIVHWDNRRAASMPTLKVWRRRLRAVPKTDDRHLEAFRHWCERVCQFPEPWADNNPLIDVVCVRGRGRG